MAPLSETGSVDPINRPADVTEVDRPRPGGYFAVSPSDARILRAADFAIKKINSIRTTPPHHFQIMEIDHAAIQVVAGLNLAFILTIRDGDDVESHRIIVYQSLDNTMSLTKDELIDHESGT